MKKLLLIALFCKAFVAVFAAGDPVTTGASGVPSPSSNRISNIDTADIIMIDLDNFIKAGNDIAVPVSIATDDTIYALDFSFKYNHANITYDTVVNQTVYIQPLAFYNPLDSTVRFTSYSSQPYATGTTLLYVHFNLLAWQLTHLDLFSLNGYLNGDPCTLRLIGGIPSGIDESNASSIQVYPNPAEGEVYVEQIPSGATLQLLDATGRKISESVSTGASRHILNTQDLPGGMYFLRVTMQDSRKTFKVMIH